MKIFRKVLSFMIVIIMIVILKNNKVLAYEDVVNKVYNINQIEEVIENAVYSRDTLVKIRYIGDTYNLKGQITSIINNIQNKDDYLKFSIISWKWDAEGYDGDVQMIFKFDYLTTKEQEDYVSNKVDEILRKLINKNMTINEKEKVIHDFIVLNVAYDESLKEHSAYSALKYGRTVCQGYALLTYKMMNQAGIETKIVDGYAGGEPHVWNLVKINGDWHHLDCTWDDPVPDVQGRIVNTYFNITDKEIAKTHIWDRDKYPSANNEYTKATIDEAKNIFHNKPWCEAYPNYKELPPILDVEIDKKFTVNFNNDVDWRSINPNTIRLVSVTNGDNIPVNFEVINFRKIKITPKFNLEKGKEYYIVINDKINGIDNGKIKEGIICPIKVKNER